VNKKIVLASCLVLTAFLVFSSLLSLAHGEVVQGWEKWLEGGSVSESDGILTLSGGNGNDVPPCLLKPFKPTGDFEISFDLKTETLGEVLLDQAGEGFTLAFGNVSKPQVDRSLVTFWLRGRAGGQFLLMWHDKNGDTPWVPFVYNGIGYNNGYDFWHPNPPQDRSNAPIQPDVWYTIKLEVQETPYVVTAEVYTETGLLLGSFSADTISYPTFDEINSLYMSAGRGVGTFHIKNMVISGTSEAENTFISISAEPSVTVGSPVNIRGCLTNGSVGFANEHVVLKYTFPGAEEWYPIGSTYTDATGNYLSQWVNTATGTFTLRAEWKGNRTHLGAYANMTLNSLPAPNGVFFVESNSTVNSLAFNSTSNELSFTVTGPSGTSGYVKATVAKSVLSNGANIKIFIDGKQLSYKLLEMPDSWLYSFDYQHSEHLVTLNLSPSQAMENPVQDENSVWILITVGMASLFLVLGISLQRKKH
jgi:hypothetical protein